MNKITTIAISALTALATLAPGAMAKSNYPAHVSLGRTIRATGVNLKFNPAECDEKNAMGWYWAYKNEMVICQENRRRGFGFQHEVRWTEEDLDTLRHEAQHLIQDCMDGSRQGALSSVYRDVPTLVKSTLSTQAIQSIMRSYSDKSDHIIMMELEAFAVAARNIPADQAIDIQKFCF